MQHDREKQRLNKEFLNKEFIHQIIENVYI